MEEIAFNLIDEPWIKVRTASLEVRTVSLKEALLQSHTYADLAGELPTQDVAVLRLLLAVLHTVFYRVDEQGRERPVKTANQALLRWKTLWEGNGFPQKPIRDYLDRWHERFWLFHPERPFYQVNGLKGTEGSIAKLNGEVPQGENKKRLFSPCSANNEERMQYPEGARWLLYLNGFADIAVAPNKRKNLDVGWLGSLGIITAIGETLFETLMLNLVFLREGNEVWDGPATVWEQESVRTGDRVEIPLPRDQAELLSMQSRRVLLKRDENAISGYTVTGGDYFSKENAFSEQMTMWMQKNDGIKIPWKPEASIQMWREFPVIVVHEKSANVPGIVQPRMPGVVQWSGVVRKITGSGRVSRFRKCCLYYDSRKSAVTDHYADEVSFHLSLLSEAGIVWRDMISSEVKRCEALANNVAKFAGNLEKAAGHIERDKKNVIVPSQSMVAAEKARERIYHRIDIPFRVWLKRIDPLQEAADRISLQQEWIGTAERLARALGEELAAQAGDAALVGRNVRERKDREVHYPTPEAVKWFQIELNRICKEG